MFPDKGPIVNNIIIIRNSIFAPFLLLLLSPWFFLFLITIFYRRDSIFFVKIQNFCIIFQFISLRCRRRSRYCLLLYYYLL